MSVMFLQVCKPCNGWILYDDKGYERLLKALRKRGEEFGLSVPAMDNLPLAVRGEERVDNAGLNQLQITSWSELPPKSKPEVFVSYAWGMILRTMHESVRKSLIGFVRHSAKKGWNILRYSEVLRPGELISGFMKRIGLADHVIVVLSDKYLRSPYCMTELHSIYQRSVGEKEDFLRRIIPMTCSTHTGFMRS